MYSQRTERLAGSLIRQLLAMTAQKEITSFAGGLPHADAFPTLDLSDLPDSIRQYGPTDGEPQLREKVAAYMQKQGLSCQADQVLVTSGSQQGIDLISKLFIDLHTPVLVESPSYLAALQSFSFFGARFCTVSLNEEGIDPDALRAQIIKDKPAFVYLIPTFQNPSGRCYSRAVREAVARVIDETGVILVEDDPYGELMFDTVDRTPIVSLLTRSAWLLLGTNSKTGIPGFRIGHIVGSKHLIELLIKIKESSDLHTNRIGQWWFGQFLDTPEYHAHLLRLRTFYKARRDHFQTILQQHFTDLADWQLPRGGLFFWLTLKKHCDTMALLEKTLTQNVAFLPGNPFFPIASEDNPSCMRLNFSHASIERVEPGLAIIAQAIKQSA